jgi:hypothetical protein
MFGDVPIPRNIDPPYTGSQPATRETSRAAAERIKVGAETLRYAVLEAIVSAPKGLTDQEQQAQLNLDGSTQRPRRIELLALFLIQPIGERTTESGRSAVVWGPTAAGEEVVRRKNRNAV